MDQVYELSKIGMVTQPHLSLKLWWTRMNECSKREVQKHIGHLPSLMEMEASPDLIKAMIKFWDRECMVFHFGDIELTPTLEEVLASYESIGMCNKRKSKSDDDILILEVWGPKDIKKAFSAINMEWMSRHKGANIPLRNLYYRFGRANGYERFKEEFASEQAWEEKRPFVFAVCLLGTMVFPQSRRYTIHPTMIMATYAIFHGIEREGVTKHYTLAPMILAEFYRTLDKCREGSRFFRGCNLILQWWMMKHLLKIHNPIEPDPKCRIDQFVSHGWWLHLNHLKVGTGQRFWMPILSELREEDVQWSIDNVVINDVIIRGRKRPFLVFPGLRGTRPYAPSRILRQLGCEQDIPQIGDIRKFATDYQNGQVPDAKMIIREWKNRNMAEDKVPNRFNPECSKEYKKWLKDDVAKIIRPSPSVPDFAENVEEENQVLQRQRMDQLMQELSELRQCMIELDECMERQIQTLEIIGHEEGVQSARDYLQENRYFIWHEVETAKGTRFSAGAGAI